MIDYDWGMRARTRPGYATYRDTPEGDPTSPYRPVRDALAPPLAPALCPDGDACTHHARPVPVQVTELDGGRSLLMTGTPREPLPEPAAPKPANTAGPDGLADDERALLLALARERTRTGARSWLLRMTRRRA